MVEFNGFVGLDTHAKTIAASVAWSGREAPEYRGEIANELKTVKKLVKALSPNGEVLSFCYEAGPCGYGLYRDLTALGHECVVVAPSLIPRKPGNRVKTDRRDSLSLARAHRSGELTAVWVPDEEHEAVRDLTRQRRDLKDAYKRSCQQLGAFLLRHGRRYESGKSKWTQRHLAWVKSQRFEQAAQQMVLQRYCQVLEEGKVQVAQVEAQMEEVLQTWRWRELVKALSALRGVRWLTAMTLVAEVGDLTRFDSPRQLMAYLGLVPSEHSSGDTRRQGGLTKTGNTLARKLLVESAWAYQYPARKTAHMRAKMLGVSAPVESIAWAAQRRLCGRYKKLCEAGKSTPLACAAVARELCGFVWAVAREMQGMAHGTRVS